MQALYDSNAPKKATNLSLNSDLLKKARDLGLNLSAVVELALAEVVQRHLAEEWKAQNREAIAAYNQQVEERGVFSDGLRSF